MLPAHRDRDFCLIRQKLRPILALATSSHGAKLPSYLSHNGPNKLALGRRRNSSEVGRPAQPLWLKLQGAAKPVVSSSMTREGNAMVTHMAIQLFSGVLSLHCTAQPHAPVAVTK